MNLLTKSVLIITFLNLCTCTSLQTEEVHQLEVTPEIRDICRLQLSGSFPHPTQCELYVRCLMFTATVRECFEGEIFDLQNRICAPGDRVTCQLDASTILPPTTSVPIITTTEVLTTRGIEGICDGIFLDILPNPDDCTSFIVCVFYIPELIPCSPNQVFKNAVDRCVPGDPETCTIFVPETTTILTPTPGNTTTLPITTLPVTTSPPTATTTGTTTVNATVSTPPSTPGNTTTIPITTIMPETTPHPPPPEGICRGNNFQFVADPFSCYRFYFCMFGAALPGECDEDRIFVERFRGCLLGDRETCTITRDGDISVIITRTP